jgi:methyl-accepting chemotaxis protein
VTFTLKTKMLLAVFTLAALSIILSAIGVSSLGLIEEKDNAIVIAEREQDLATNSRSHTVAWFRNVEFLTVSDLSPARLADARKHAGEAQRALERDLTALSGLVHDDASRQDIQSALRTIGEYRQIQAKVDSLYDQKKYGEVEKIILDSSPICERIENELERILERNDRQQADTLKAATDTIHQGRGLLLTLAVIGNLVVVGASLWLIVFGVSRPLEGITGAIGAVAGGNLSVDVPGLGRADEIGQLASALETFKQNGQERRRMLAEQERQKAEAEAEKHQVLNRLADQFESGVRGVVSAVSAASSQLQSNAQSLSATADQANRQATAVAAAADQATTNVQTVAAATEELSSSVNEISRQVSESSRIASSAVEEANRTNTTIAGLSEAAQKIGEVVGLINNIASQTNLLALNATIEAARAGEAGKGFAVVASEVKNLANQTAKATEDIQSQVAGMQSVTGNAVEAIKGIGNTIRHMSEITTTIASAVEEQGAATREIARNVQEAATGTRTVSGTIAEVTRAASETGQMADSVLHAASALSSQADTLRREVDGFISRVRSA